MEISDLLGTTLSKVLKIDDNVIEFTSGEGKVYKMYHEQDCCEDVKIEDICGDLNDLVGSPILLAEEVSNSKEIECGSCTWTFYKLATNKGAVTIRWYGESNGYYSESVSFEEVKYLKFVLF